jgi:hypothetical protein
MGITMLFIGILAALLIAAVFIKIIFFMIKFAFKLLFGLWAIAISLVFLPVVMLVLIPVGIVFCMLLVLLGLMALPLVLPIMLALIVLLALPLLLIKCLVC